MRYLTKTNTLIQGIGAKVSGLAILSMMIIIVLDVIMRNIFNTPIPGSYVIIESFLMPIAIFPALGYVYMVNVLPRLGEFIAKRPEWFQKMNRLLLLIIDTIVFGLLIYYSSVYFLQGFQNQMSINVATNLILIWPIYFFVPLGYSLVLLEVLIRLIKEFLIIKKEA